MAGFYLFMHMLIALLGTSDDRWACYEANPVYIPRDPYAAACILDADNDPFRPHLRVYLDWQGNIGSDITRG